MTRPILYLEPIGGIAGDMFLAAALDLGVRVEEVTQALSGLGLSGYRIRAEPEKRHEIQGTHVDVELDGHDVSERSLLEIEQRIASAKTLSDSEKQRALSVFRAIGAAEAKIHGVPIEQIHFHEVGAIDSIVDVCAAAVVVERLGNPEIFSAPPPMGSGFIEAAHGRMPIPAPATVEILRDVPVRFEGMGELTTPTGAALLKALCRVESPPQMTIQKVGYGVGTKDFKDRPNVLRATLGQSTGAGQTEAAWVIEANVDDMSPQLLGGLIPALLEKGALDAYLTAATMKKGRPGHLITVLCAAKDRDALIDWIFRASTTIGVRTHPVERRVLDRHHVTVETRYGPVRIKVAQAQGEELNASPEYEDCVAAAAEKKVPLKQVFAAALAAYHRA